MSKFTDFLHKQSSRNENRDDNENQHVTQGLIPAPNTLPNGKSAMLINIDDQLLNTCSELLNENYGVLIQYSDVDENRQKLMDLLINGELFQALPVHQNELLARSVLNYIIDLGPINILLERYPNITDISYNGRFLTYETNENKYVYGNQPGEDLNEFTPDKVDRLILKFTNGDENHFQLSASNPIFNGMYRNLRVSAHYNSLTPKGIGSTFSLRISKANLVLNNDNFHQFAPEFIYDKVLVPLMQSHANVLISGETGTGKTELQKLLVQPISLDDKIIMIEDTPETNLQTLYPDKDIFNWVTNEVSDANDSANVNIADHVAMALRNNPKWIMVSETRGSEAYLMFQAVMTGQSLTTTLHSMSNAAVPSRFIGMIIAGAKYSPDIKQLRADFLRYMHIGIHVSRKKIGGHVYRYMDEMAEFVPESDQYPDGVNVLFSQRLENRDGVAIRHWKTGNPTAKLKDLVLQQIDVDFEMPYVHETNDVSGNPSGYEEVVSNDSVI